MSRPFRIGVATLLLGVLGACAPKGDADDGAGTTAESAAATDSTGLGTAGAPGADSVSAALRSPPVSLRDSASKTAAAAKSTKSKGTDIVGRDSAFGPSFIVDSTGKMVPIPTKKP